MAPSTATPSNLHRAPVACLKCRAGKVRCLVAQNASQCQRCTTNNTECVFTHPKRARHRPRNHPHSRRLRVQKQQTQEEEQEEQPAPASDHAPISSGPPSPLSPHVNHHAPRGLITPEIRARIIAALATLKGKSGAPFSFVTSGDRPSGADESTHHQPLSSDQLQPSAPSLKLSWLLNPLQASNPTHTRDSIHQTTPLVKMPTYLDSMTLGQTMTDPVDNGILTYQASEALFHHFMLQMNAKWEYLLDPHVDTHDDVRRRSRLLFATVLYCSSKFANCINGSLVSTTDPFLQSRLCSVARNLAVRAFAEGDRSIETMQAFYLLACWKDADDDVSYRHSGYAFRFLHDLDWDASDGERRQAVRRKRTWVALFRQDKQQSLFFMKRATSSMSDDDHPFVNYLDTWLRMPHVLPQDYMACCSADLRRLQSKIRGLVQKAPSIMLPCLLEQMDSELNRWKLAWEDRFERKLPRLCPDDSLPNRPLMYPGRYHLRSLIGLWENSVRLNIASAILRQAITASVEASLRANGHSPPSAFRLDLPGIPPLDDVLSPDVAGLRSSIEGSFGTLRYLLEFSSEDLRRAPDSVLLLGPNAALFLCLLLCLPCNGVLGPAFQKTAISLIQDIALHVGQAVQSPQDIVSLHSAYLNSLVNLLGPAQQWPPSSQEVMEEFVGFDLQESQMEINNLQIDETAMEAAQVLAGGMVSGLNCNMDDSDAMFRLPNEPEQMLHIQSLANLLDTNFFSAMSPMPVDVSSNTEQ
ncbi:hypothetical protein FSARC_8416 [Fusarium sarcochroum]|uniref:Zn(2)-C6 fungal-type domain-containing protein n=1 Tax=Fusarium sarcochroum TaxID=1208366 RepID=A0A8H4TTF4_9HYPO|nr:hypothetical protein FSARC_8416 [Fusarium sarcochroum]